MFETVLQAVRRPNPNGRGGRQPISNQPTFQGADNVNTSKFVVGAMQQAKSRVQTLIRWIVRDVTHRSVMGISGYKIQEFNITLQWYVQGFPSPLTIDEHFNMDKHPVFKLALIQVIQGCSP